MSDSIEAKGKTVNDAVSEALLQLGLRRDEVEIKVIEEPKSGLLGFIGGRPAKVMVRKKAARGRGGRSNRKNDDQAHSLSGGRGGRGGRSRGGRGRGGRRGGGAKPEERQGAKEQQVAAEGKESRGRRPARGDKAEARRDGGGRPDSGKQQESRQGGGRQDSRRRGGRGRGRSDRDDQQVTVARTEEKTSRSRRGSRGGRGRGRADARDEANTNRNAGASAQVVNEAPSRSDKPKDQRRETGKAAPSSPNNTPNNKANRNMTNENKKPTPAETPQAENTKPAAAAAETPTVTPKPKKKGWGGGIGSRLPRKANPAVKSTPEPRVIEEAAPQASAPAPRREPRDSGRGRDDYRDRRQPAEIDEVIIDAVAASKYAKQLSGVTEENLDENLIELASGMLARAGFPCEVEVGDGEYRQVRISSDEESAGMLIGRHGQTVDAVEHLVERMACNAVDDRVRMNLDINGYRQRRSESLKERVAEAVGEVRETGKAYHVEPMSARERRLVHLEVEPMEGVRTYTMIGSGGKYVVIALDDESDEASGNED